MLNRETLHQLQAEQNLYVLADHSGLPGLSQALRRFGIGWTNLFGNNKRPELLKASPLLFELPQRLQVSHWLEDNANFSHGVLLIGSQLPMNMLASRLAQRCDGLLSGGEGVIIRFFDTRVFPELLKVLPDADRAAWLGCADTWWYQARDGRLARVESAFNTDERISLPLTLTDEQLEALIKASEPDQVSDILAQYTPKEFLAIPLQKRYSFVLNMIERASSIGISAPMDYAMYCGMMLLKGAEFDKSPGWATLREQILRGEITLAEAIEYVESEEA